MLAAVVARVQLGDGSVEIQSWGERRPGTPILLLHEALGSVGLWRDFPVRLQRATDRQVIAFSRFGHGASDPPPHPRTRSFFEEEALQTLPELLEHLDLHDPILLGHSDGASIALIHAAHHPVAALILLAPHVFVEEITVAGIRRTRTSYLDGNLRERMRRHHADPDAVFWGWCGVWLDPAFRTWSLEEEAARVSAPTLLIQGAEDPYASLAQLDRIERNVRGPIERFVPPGGHSPHLEQMEAVIESVGSFLDRDRFRKQP